MEDQLHAYKSVHQQRYAEREAKREALFAACKGFGSLPSMESACISMHDVLKLLDDPDVVPIIKAELGLDVLQGLNDNAQLRVSITDRHHANDLHVLLKRVMEKCGCDPDIELEFDMDCSKDEEIARALAETFGHAVTLDEDEVPVPQPTLPPKRTRRPRKPRVTSTNV